MWLDSESAIRSTSRAESGVGVVGVAAPVLDDPLVAGVVGEVDVEAAAVGVVGRERDREQPLLAARGHLVADVEEGRVELAAVAHDHHAAALLDDELARAVAGRRRDVDRRVERADPLEPHAARGARRTGASGAALAVGVAAGAGAAARPRRRPRRRSSPPRPARGARRRRASTSPSS